MIHLAAASAALDALGGLFDLASSAARKASSAQHGPAQTFAIGGNAPVAGPPPSSQSGAAGSLTSDTLTALFSTQSGGTGAGAPLPRFPAPGTTKPGQGVAITA